MTFKYILRNQLGDFIKFCSSQNIWTLHKKSTELKIVYQILNIWPIRFCQRDLLWSITKKNILNLNYLYLKCWSTKHSSIEVEQKGQLFVARVSWYSMHSWPCSLKSSVVSSAQNGQKLFSITLLLIKYIHIIRFI